MDWIPANRTEVAVPLDRIPAGSFLLTSCYTDQRGGVPVKWVQQCCMTPPMVMLAVEKGHALSPVIRDSRAFAICQLDPNDRGTVRSFDHQQPGIDPFAGMTSTTAPSGSPVPMRALGYIDCELARHVDIDGDYEIYVGVVHHAAVLREGADPMVCLCDRAAAATGSAPSASTVNGTRNGTSTASNASRRNASRDGTISRVRAGVNAMRQATRDVARTKVASVRGKIAATRAKVNTARKRG